MSHGTRAASTGVCCGDIRGAIRCTIIRYEYRTNYKPCLSYDYVHGSYVHLLTTAPCLST
eukprot:scaffold420689_cov14-Prasinocladus_malaysianus.AAC.1